MNLGKLLGMASPTSKKPPQKGYMKLGTDVLSVMETLASPNRFYLQFTQDGCDLDVIDILCKSVSFPEVTRTAGEYHKHGIKYEVPMELGLTNEISATFVQAEGENDVRSKFIKLLENPSREAGLILGQFGTKPITGGKTIGSYIANFLGAPPPQKEYYIINMFKYYHIFVKSVGAIELSSSATEAPEFTVTLGFAWMTDLNNGLFSEDHYPLIGSAGGHATTAHGGGHGAGDMIDKATSTIKGFL